MTVEEIISLTASLASLILAIVAIWLSITFYKFSNDLSKETRESADTIKSSVDRLEKLFDKLYTDTFSMMKETVADIREHAWEKTKVSDETSYDVEFKKNVNQQIDAIKNDVYKKINDIFESQKTTDSRFEDFRKEIREIAEDTIQKSVGVESIAKEQTIRKVIIQILRKRKKPISASNLYDILKVKGFHSLEKILEDLKKLEEEGIVLLTNTENTSSGDVLDYILPATIIRLENKNINNEDY